MDRTLYQEHLIRLRELYPDTDLLSVQQAADYLKMDKRTLLNAKSSPIRRINNRYIVPIINLAHWLS